MNNAKLSYRGWKNKFHDILSEIYDDREVESLFFGTLDMIGWSKLDYILKDEEHPSKKDEKRLASALKRLQTGEPLQYITGKVFFDDLTLNIDERALIPRPETEELVHWIVTMNLAVTSILDVCTGCGCIALALRNRLDTAKVFGWDISDEALSLANENKVKLGLDVSFFKGDALGDWSEIGDTTYDVIVSNPPYIPQSDARLMFKNVLEHEPHMALFVSDDDPLIFYREIAKRALKFLKPGGRLYFEIHEDFPQDMIDLMELLGYVDIEVKKDLQGKDRMLCAHKRA